MTRNIAYSSSELRTKFIQKHGIVYSYGAIPQGNVNRKIKIGCAIHGVFIQSIRQHYRGNGCPMCGKISAPILRKQAAVRNSTDLVHISHFSRYITQIRHSAKKRGIVFSLTACYLQNLWVSQSGRCAITKLYMTHNHRYNRTNRKLVCSLDRINSQDGYNIGNVQWVILPINHMKSTMSNDECRKLLTLIKESI